MKTAASDDAAVFILNVFYPIGMYWADETRKSG